MLLDRQTLIKQRIVDTSKFYGRRFKPSTQANFAFSKIFSLFFPKFSDVLTIKTIDWNLQYLQIILDDTTNNGETLELKFRKQENAFCNGKFCTQNICNGVHYQISNKNFLRFLLGFQNLGKEMTLDSLLSVLGKDFKAKRDYYQIFFKPERPPFSVIQDWSHPLQEFRFIVNEGFVRNTDQSLNLNLPKVTIHHSERECQGITPNNKATGYHFFNFPKGYYDGDAGKKTKNGFDKYYYLSEEERQKYIGDSKKGYKELGISTDLDENDIVMGGGNEKLNQAINIAIDYAEKNDIKLVTFNCCCVPRIVGDDVHSTLLHAREKMNIPFLFKGQFEKTPYEQKVFLLEKYIEKIDTQSIVKVNKSISLFGFQENLYQKELCDILTYNNIKINGSFIPTIDVRLLDLMYTSELFVFSPNKLQKEAFEYPFQSIGIPFITPKFPSGIENSKKWVKMIAENLHIDLKIPNEVLQVQEQYFELVNTVREKKFKVGLIFLGLPELKRFFNPDYTNNIDVVDFLKEMGFFIEFIVFDNFKPYENNRDDCYKQKDGDHNSIENMIHEKVGEYSEFNISYFGNSKEFGTVMDTSGLHIVYSDIYFDDRIIGRGLSQCNLRNFYVGHTGALKTIKELIGLCELSFYKNFYQYFLK